MGQIGTKLLPGGVPKDRDVEGIFGLPVKELDDIPVECSSIHFVLIRKVTSTLCHPSGTRFTGLGTLSISGCHLMSRPETANVCHRYIKVFPRFTERRPICVMRVPFLRIYLFMGTSFSKEKECLKFGLVTKSRAKDRSRSGPLNHLYI